MSRAGKSVVKVWYPRASSSRTFRCPPLGLKRWWEGLVFQIVVWREHLRGGETFVPGVRPQFPVRDWGGEEVP